MAGFDARKLPSNNIHDHLHARALIFEASDCIVAIISVEVIAVSAEFSESVRRRISSATSIPVSNIILSATHTHCGPVTLSHFFNQGQPLDLAYLETLASGIVDAAVEAFQQRQERLLKTGMVPVSGIAVNRRTADGFPVDPFAGVLLIEELDGTAAAIAVLYACHTTVLGPNTLSITQDFPFYTLEKLRTAIGSSVEALYLNGAEGDLSIGHKSDLSAVGIIDSFRTFATAQRLGERLADAVLEGLQTLVAEPPLLEVLTAHPRLRLKQYAPLATMTKAKEAALADLVDGDTSPEMLSKRQRSLFARIEEYYAMLCEASPEPEPKHLPVECIALRLGNTALVTLPGEIFVRIALNIRESSPFARTFFLGLANDYIGYVPDEEATVTSGYEVVASRVPAQAGVVLQTAAADLLAALHATRMVTA
jgi:hypothetical protein